MSARRGSGYGPGQVNAVLIDLTVSDCSRLIFKIWVLTTPRTTDWKSVDRNQWTFAAPGVDDEDSFDMVTVVRARGKIPLQDKIGLLHLDKPFCGGVILGGDGVRLRVQCRRRRGSALTRLSTSHRSHESVIVCLIFTC